MHALPVPFHLAVEDGVLILRFHLSLGRHLGVPALDGGDAEVLLGQGGGEGADDAVDTPEAFTVAVLLRRREPVGDFPEEAPEEGLRGAEGSGEQHCCLRKGFFFLKEKLMGCRYI